MTRAFSMAFKQKMVHRLTGKNAVNPSQLARETGIRQQNLSRWLEQARSLPVVVSDQPNLPKWTVEQKARIVAEGSKFTGEQLTSYLDGEGVKLAQFECWRQALAQDGRDSVATSKHIRKLERELTRKEKALAEAAALLVLKKTIESLYQDEDDVVDE
jgi:transposase